MIIRPTFAEIDLNKIERNIQNIKAGLASNIRFMAVVKADAYGHGLVPVAQKAIESGAEWLGVAIPEEGEALRLADIPNPILVLGGIPSYGVDKIIELGLRQTVFSKGFIEALEAAASRKQKKVYVHIKIDTGMNRIGINSEAYLAEMLDLLENCKYVQLEGMFTHFAVSDTADKSFTLKQNSIFQSAIRLAKNRGFDIPVIHAANSAAILDYPDSHYNMVRAGISMYGYYPSDEVDKSISLYPVMTWKTHIIHMKTIHAGDSVSYGRTFTASQDMVIATLPVGYADGYRRLLSNKAFVLVGGMRAPVVGRVCMDQCMIDITNIPGVEVEDEVVLLGTQGSDSIDADEMASWCDTISYEILTSISKRVPRRYVNDYTGGC